MDALTLLCSDSRVHMNVIDGLIAWSLLLLGAVAAGCKWWCLMCVVALLDGCTDALVI